MKDLDLGGNILTIDDEADCCCSTMSMVFRWYGDDISRSRPGFAFAMTRWTRGSIREGVRGEV